MAFQKRFLRRLGTGLHLGELFDYLPEVYLYVKDRQSRFVKVNRTLYVLRGYESEDQMIGKSDFDIHPRHLAEQYVDEDRRVMRGRVAIPNQVWLVPAQAGVLKWFVSSKMPLFAPDGRVIGLAGVMRDLEKTESLLRPYQEMEQTVQFVVQNYERRIEIPELARMASLSVSQFDRKFKQLFQMTPQQYILRVRINAACQALIAGVESVAEIALRTGFYDQSYFTKQFRKQMGVTPLAYRRKHGREGGGLRIKE